MKQTKKDFNDRQRGGGWCSGAEIEGGGEEEVLLHSAYDLGIFRVAGEKGVPVNRLMGPSATWQM